MEIKEKKVMMPLFDDVSTYVLLLNLRTSYVPIWRNWGLTIKESDKEFEAMSTDELLEIIAEYYKEHRERVLESVKNYCVSKNFTYPNTMKIPETIREIKTEDDLISAFGIEKAKIDAISKSAPIFLPKLEIEFKRVLNDPWNGFFSFQNHVSFWAKKWKPSSYFAPYIALVQSSGTGKSKLLYEYGKVAPVIYVCTRPVISTGFPLRTPLIADILLNPSEFFLSVKAASSTKSNQCSNDIVEIVVYCSYLAGTMRSLYEYLDPDNCSSQSELLKKLIEWNENQFFGTDPNYFMNIRNNISGILNGVTIQTHDADLWAIVNCGKQMNYECDRLRKYFQSNELPVLFAFDEASSMVKYGANPKRLLINSLRYALSLLPDGKDKGVNFLGVLLDTLTTLSNFNPSRMNDPSLRFVYSNNLMDPFIEVNNWNVSLPRTGVLVKENSITEKFDLFLKCGRPLWMSLHPGNVLYVATVKLIGQEIEKEINQNAALAVVAARFNLKISAGMRISSELCRSHLAVCYYADRGRDEMFIGYPSEPIIGLAAQQLMANNSEYSLAKILPFVVNSIRSGFVAAGERGELTSRFLFANAYDKCAKSPDSATIGVTLEIFLKSLFSEYAWEKLQRSINESDSSVRVWNLLKDGIVSFTQFVQCEYPPSLTDIPEWFSRSASGISKFQQRGFDGFFSISLGTDTWSVCLKSDKNVKGTGDSLHEEACYTSSLYFGQVIQKISRSNDESDFVTEVVEHPYLVLSLNMNAEIDDGSIGCYQISDSRKTWLREDLKKFRNRYLSKSNRSAIKGYMHRVDADNWKDDKLFTVLPDPEKQLTIGVSGWRLEDGKRMFNLSAQEEKWLKALIDASASAKDLIKNKVLKSSMLSIEISAKDRQVKIKNEGPFRPYCPVQEKEPIR